MDEQDKSLNKKVSPPGELASAAPAPSFEEYLKKLQRNEKDLLGLLQNTRAEAQNIRDLFCDLENDIVTFDNRIGIDEILKPYRNIYNNNKDVINEHISRMATIVFPDINLNQWMGDDIKVIENCWERFREFCPDFDKPAGKDALLIGIRKCEGFLAELIFQCSRKSIPERLIQHLHSVENGQALDFYETFSDELCTREQATTILNYLANHPSVLKDRSGILWGMFDPSKGLVYKIGTRKQIIMSVVKIFVWCLFGFIGSYLILDFYKVYQAPAAWTANISPASIALLFIVMIGGAAAHTAIGMLKESRSAKPQQLLAINHIIIWLHIKEAPMISSILIVVLGFIIMMVTYSPITPEVLFIAGYSIDSLGDLFINRFETTMDTKGAVLKSAIQTK